MTKASLCGTRLDLGVHVSVTLMVLVVTTWFHGVESYQTGEGTVAIEARFLGVQHNKRRAHLGYITDPMPTSFEVMQNVNTTGMEKSRLENEQIIYTFPVNEDQFVSGSLRAHHEWEGDAGKSICAEFEGTAGPADFLDVGANIGAYSISMALCLKNRGHGGKVIAVEGLPNIARFLKASVVANKLQDNVDVYNYALGDGTMTADTVRMNLAPTNKGGSSILGYKPAGLVEGGDVQDGTVVDAMVTTLDSILYRDGHKLPNIFAVKMDIEGSEGHALQGAQKFLSKAAPCLLQVELNKDWLNRAGTPVESVLQLLQNAGFDTPRSFNHEMSTTTFRQKDFDKCLSKFAK